VVLLNQFFKNLTFQIMKTSNKILFGLIIFIGLCCFSFMIYAKGQLISIEQNREHQETGFIIQNDVEVFGFA